MIWMMDAVAVQGHVWQQQVWMLNITMEMMAGLWLAHCCSMGCTGTVKEKAHHVLSPESCVSACTVQWLVTATSTDAGGSTSVW